MAGRHREVTRLIKRLTHEFGCTATRDSGKHWKVSRPGVAQIVTVSHSPSDARALRNIHADLRRYLGIVL